jgi:hypoxanthine-DNA glycosylase
MKKEGFPPLIDENTKVLVLGTMPGDRSILTGEYYANPTNHFWNIIFRALNSGVSVFGYKEKTELLLKNRIGLWDVLYRANRIGSLDSNIHNEEFNDFEQLFKDFPKISAIIFNGQKPANYFKGFGNIPNDFEFYILPSTSSANTTKTFERKFQEWKDVITKYNG